MGQLLARIILNPKVCHGKLTISSKQYPVELILDLLSVRSSHEEILADYPTLENEDTWACLQYAAKLAKVKSISKVLSHKER